MIRVGFRYEDMAKGAGTFVCDRCFQDKRLRDWIQSKGAPGPCSWCGARRCKRVPLESLGDIFREAVQLYRNSDSDRGDLISDLLQHDWEVFSERISEARNDRMHEMTVAILESGLHPKDDDYHGEYRELFIPDDDGLEEDWHERVERLVADSPLMAGGPAPARPSPEEEAEYGPDPIEFAIEDMARRYDAERTLFRARIHKDRARESKFTREEVGAPPPDRAPAGRANRRGEPVLYLASDPETALAEVRAWKGAAVAIGTLRCTKPLRILDLSIPHNVESPFFDEDIQWTCKAIGLFRRFAEELSRPVITGEEQTLYIPSQGVCDTVRAAGFHGVAYPSAMGSGHNVVLFEVTAASVEEVRYVRVTSVVCEHRDFGEYETPYRDWPYGDATMRDEASEG